MKEKLEKIIADLNVKVDEMYDDPDVGNTHINYLVDLIVQLQKLMDEE